MNTVTTPGTGDKNGRVQAWIDGELVLDVDTLRLCDYENVKVDKFYLSTFHGGSSAEWAPTHDCFIRYDNFTVSTDSIAISLNSPVADRGDSQEDAQGITRVREYGKNYGTAKIYRINGTFVVREINEKRIKIVR